MDRIYEIEKWVLMVAPGKGEIFDVFARSMARIRGSRGRLVVNAVVLLIFALNSCWNSKPIELTT
jgi:hypothetical protein